jgi:hypothetical protein
LASSFYTLNILSPFRRSTRNLFNFNRARPTLVPRIGAHQISFINVPWNVKGEMTVSVLPLNSVVFIMGKSIFREVGSRIK